MRRRFSCRRRLPTPTRQSTWLQDATGLAGIVLVLLVAVSFYLTNAPIRAQQQPAQPGQITDRFTRALDELDSDKLDVRLNGIYALERLMHRSRDDRRRTIIDVLVAYIREHAPASLPVRSNATVASATRPGHRQTATDVQAAMTVLGRRIPSAQDDVLDLSGIVLAGAKLNRAHLAGANLNGADLAAADLGAADLGAASLIGANLSGANLGGTNLRDADVSYADLTDAHLGRADLAHANLTEATLTGADLSGAELSGADLTGAELSGAGLSGADLRAAHRATGDSVRCVDVGGHAALPAGLARPVPGPSAGNGHCHGDEEPERGATTCRASAWPTWFPAWLAARSRAGCS